MDPLNPYVAITEISLLLLLSFGVGFGWSYVRNQRRIRQLQRSIQRAQQELINGK